MVPEAKGLTADKAEIRRDLEAMTARWGELGEPVMFEIRAFAEGKQPQNVKYSPDWIDDAVAFCAGMNDRGFNVYSVRNPIRQDCKGSASDADIVAALSLWADCDDNDAAGNVLRFPGPKWTRAVTTGSTPGTRVHTYWDLTEPCLDLAVWRAMQQSIASFFGSDASVINPSRIMRVGGTISWPDSRKQGKGYVPEMVKIRTVYDDGRGPVTLDQMTRAFGAGTPATQVRATHSFQIDTGGGDHKSADDYADMLRRARTDGEKHTGVRDLAASLAGSGVPRSMAEAMVREACPVWDAGVEKLIETAYAKFYRAPEAAYASPEALQPAPPDAEPSFDAPPHPTAKVEWYDDIEPSVRDSYIVKGVLSQLAMSCVYGPSNSGKTFFVLDLCFHIAIGAPWRKHRVKQAAVLYLAAEGGRGVINRIAALKLDTGVADVPLALHRAGLDLLHDQADLQAVVDLAATVKAKRTDLPLLIVIDTLSRVMAGGDENSAQDMTALIRNIDALREMIGCHVLLVHHTGKDSARGARGHSSLRAAVDTEIELEVEGESRAALVTKQRDYSGGEIFAFALKTILLGVDEDGDEVTSCVVEHVDSEDHVAAMKAKKGLGGNQKLIADTFDQMVGEGLARPNPGGVGFPEPGKFWTVELDDLRDEAMGKMAATNKRGAFLEAWKALTDRGLFCAAGGKTWRTDKRINK